MATVSVQQALQYVASHPEQATDVMIDVPIWEMIARALYYIANNPDASKRGSVSKAIRAQKILLDRMVGTRRAGTNPVTMNQNTLDFVDLTGGELE